MTAGNKDQIIKKRNTRQRGSQGEAAAANFLNGKGYRVISTGYRTRFGEIDIIAEYKEFIVFVEVKLRKNANFAHAREHVGKTKQRKIITTAGLWLARYKSQLQPRFDVIEVYTENPEINHIENAFGV